VVGQAQIQTLESSDIGIVGKKGELRIRNSPLIF
jgi:hypothetical protein